MKFFKSKKGLTLIELLISIAIIAILIALLLPTAARSRMRARDARRVMDLKNFSAALELYYEKNGHYPCWKEGGGLQDNGGNNALKVLVDEGFIEALPEDPKKDKYVYYYASDPDCNVFKLFTYTEEDKKITKKDGGTSDRCYEVFSAKDDYQVQISDDKCLTKMESWKMTYNSSDGYGDTTGKELGEEAKTTVDYKFEGNGSGHLLIDGQTCLPDCSKTIAVNESLISTAVTSTDSYFSGWTVFKNGVRDDSRCQSLDPCTVQGTAGYDFLIIAKFEKIGVALNCLVKSSACETDEKLIFKMRYTSNSHAELKNQTYYSNNVCCSSSDNTLNNTCENNFDIALRLFYETNSHVAEKQYLAYQYRVCLSSTKNKVECKYENAESCSSGYTCLASMSAERNTHVGDCVTNPFSLKVCCRLVP